MTVHCLLITTLGNEIFVQNCHLDTVVFIVRKAWKMRRPRPRFSPKLAAFLVLLDHLHDHGKASLPLHPEMLLQLSASKWLVTLTLRHVLLPGCVCSCMARFFTLVTSSIILVSLQCLLDWDCQTSPSSCGSKVAKWFRFFVVTMRIKMSTSLINESTENYLAIGFWSLSPLCTWDILGMG